MKGDFTLALSRKGRKEGSEPAVERDVWEVDRESLHVLAADPHSLHVYSFQLDSFIMMNGRDHTWKY